MQYCTARHLEHQDRQAAIRHIQIAKVQHWKISTARNQSGDMYTACLSASGVRRVAHNGNYSGALVHHAKSPRQLGAKADRMSGQAHADPRGNPVKFQVREYISLESMQFLRDELSQLDPHGQSHIHLSRRCEDSWHLKNCARELCVLASPAHSIAAVHMESDA